ncbi:MAG: exonuclease domain-containing protein [bacterium]
MTPERKFWLWVVALAAGMFTLVGLQAALFYLTQADGPGALSGAMWGRLLVFLVLAQLTLLPFLVWAMRSWYRRYVVPLHRLGEDVEALLYGSHHARLPLDGRDPAGLAPLLNALMQRYQQTEEAVQGRLEAALGALGEEKSRLEALLEGLSEGVVEYSTEGRIVRFNEAARTLFAGQVDLGLGLAVDRLIEPAITAFAHESLQQQLAKEVPHPFASFTCRNAGEGQLRARIAPLLVFGGRLAGYVLTVEPETAGPVPPPAVEAKVPRPVAAQGPAVRPGRGKRAEQPLGGLRFVVLDTETTGLEPMGGDEVISLGAVVVYRGHVLAGETFDRLVNPGRPVKPSAQRVHGLSDDRLRGSPPIDEVLPEFLHFAHGSVLVAHNAAFDMAFLRRAADRSDLSLTHPVLDTMLLSALLHPHQPSHSLDALLARYGLPVSNRHSALGDALMTAELLLRLLPQLEERGIATLEAALAASRTTPLARLTYG